MFKPVLTLDLRSLALLRICFGFLVIIDTLERLPYLREFQTDTGLMPVAALWGLADVDPAPHRILCLHAFSGALWWQVLLALVSLSAGLGLLLGWRTRITSFLCWFLVLSVQMRNPILFFGGDIILRMILFWGIFLPWGRVWSLDAKSQEAPERIDFVGVASFCYILQLAYQYWLAGMFKTSSHWLTDGTAIYHSLVAAQYESTAGQFVADFIVQQPWLGSLLTFTTLAWERFFPLLIFCPFAPKLCRSLSVLSIWAFHGGLAVLMSLGTFPILGLACAVGAIPTFWWDKVSRFSVQTKEESGQVSPPAPAWIAAIAAIWTIVFGLAVSPQISRPLPRQARHLGAVLGLNQIWMLFAPEPPIRNGYYVAAGRTKSGESFQLIGEIKPLTWEKPSLAPPAMGPMRWRMVYYRLLTRRGFRHFREVLCRVLHQKWIHEGHKEELERVDLYYVWGRSSTQGENVLKPERLWSYKVKSLE